MLVFEKEGFLEIEDSQIEELYRSPAPISLEVPGNAPFPLHVALCRHNAGTSSACHVAFYCRTLKRALIYGVKQAPGISVMKSLMQILQNLGFQLEQVNLGLSPALRQVVLRDISGLLTPADASRQRSEKAAMLAELEATLSTGDADSDAVKRATHKLNAERHLDNRAMLLRNTLESRMGGVDDPAKELLDLTEKAAVLNIRLEQALALADEERRQREQVDGIRVAVEKRLQELEADLVTAETRSSASLVKISRHENTIKKLRAQLAESAGALGTAQAKEGVLAAANRQLEEEIGLLRGELKNSTSRNEALEQNLAAAGKTASVATQAAEREVLTLRERCHALEQKLAAAGKTAGTVTQAEEPEVLTLRERCHAFEQELARVTAELADELNTHKQLIKIVAADEKRIAELEAALNDAKKLAGQQSGGKGSGASKESARLEEELAATSATAQRERQAREKAEQGLDEAQLLIDDLRQTVKTLQAREVAARSPAAMAPDERQHLEKMSGQLHEAEVQLEQERLEVKKLGKALAEAEKNLVTLEARLQESRSHPAAQTVVAHANASGGRKPLPHETRPAPSPGALFHPDWDLAGLPCRSPDQILQAWGSIYNVQLALEGYPSQYCTAFIVVLKEGSRKRLYLLFNLKKDNHILVCVPGKAPRDEAALKNLVNEAQNYLKLSGFELEKIAPAEVATYLKGYYSPS